MYTYGGRCGQGGRNGKVRWENGRVSGKKEKYEKRGKEKSVGKSVGKFIVV